MSMMKRRALTLLVGLTTLLLGACSGVGDGNSLQSLVLVSSDDASLTFDDLKTGNFGGATVFECGTGGLTLFGLFTRDGSFGNFTPRATWSSSNTAVATVSNGDIVFPGTTDSFYPVGTVIPVAAGNAVITARYLDLSATIDVTVKTPQNVVLEPASLRMAPNSQGFFRVTALLDGIKQDVTAFAQTVAFATPDDTIATASFDLTGPVVRALSPGGPLTLNVTLPICNRTLSSTVSVAPVTSLVMQHEPGFSGDIIVPTNERVKVLADFGDGPEQDLTTQSAYTVNTTTDTTATTRIIANRNFITALTAGAPVEVSAACCAFDRNADGDITDELEAATSTSNSLSFTPVAATLTAFNITPTDARVEQFSSPQFNVTGVYDGGARTQDITRYVSWFVTNPAVSTTVASPLLTVISSAGFSETAGLGVFAVPPTVDRVTVDTPLTLQATLASAVQPATALPAQTTTVVVTPAPAP
ncbi:hypothetical protein SAMN04488068_2028 [Hydrocarboniphaga daqingensis]|uniref:BIG2 domain-containing protein n=1 Tax=Hydrocarboniphaga daqingensis TaxID=490188 RepID=A0A1M5P560_9GAMM|nr:hypothetical protein [Hydrocarboniphaga daqingensis]SHG96888.1 hypothetical protein SAMN04488068_2028 [Hydrocarboniphaga daqingensis]